MKENLEITKYDFFIGIFVFIGGLFLFTSSFQSNNCHYNNNNCMGMNTWLNWLYNIMNTNAFFEIGYMIFTALCLFSGAGMIFMYLFRGIDKK